MKNAIKTWVTASAYISIGIALGMLLNAGKKKSESCKANCRDNKEEPPKQKTTAH